MLARILVLGLIAFTSSAFGGTPAARTWTSKDGSASLTATFNKVVGDRVTLILPNGRAQYVKKDFLSDADVAWIEARVAETAAAEDTINQPAGASASAKMPAALAGKLIDDRGSRFALGKDGPIPTYYLFYYSASWCGPCHAFTPTLISFARMMKARKASVMVILSPADKSQEDEVAYMTDMRMPWPGLAFDQRDAKGIPRNGTGYIPSMVLADANGKVLLEVGEKLSPDDFLAQTEKIVRGSSTETAKN